jgi:hypothetical protein
VRENRQHGSEGGEGNLPDPYRCWQESTVMTAGITPYGGSKRLSLTREKLIQHYLRKTRAKREGGTIHWARATLRGRART